MRKNIIIKEYSFYFEDNGNRYSVNLCRGIPHTRPFVARMDGRSRKGTPLKVLRYRASNWRDIISFWYIQLCLAVHRLKRNMIKQIQKQKNVK